MQTLQVKISQKDYKKFNFAKDEIKFDDLVDIINKDYARNALIQSNKIAKSVGLSKLTIDDINKEIKAVRISN